MLLFRLLQLQSPDENPDYILGISANLPASCGFILKTLAEIIQQALLPSTTPLSYYSSRVSNFSFLNIYLFSVIAFGCTYHNTWVEVRGELPDVTCVLQTFRRQGLNTDS